MLIKREQIEEREGRVLAPYAVKSAQSRGRQYPEREDPFRTCFQRDRGRIIHSKAFRRLKGKTQVFVAHYGDHYRSRLTHSMEVAQLSRDAARMLGLNEDLAEAIGLAHDLGHTPFGHAGQDELNEIMKKYGQRFEHNEQSRRIVEVLEEKTPDHPGLNLSFEIRDGLIKHRTEYDKPLATDTLMPSLEAQIVNIADEIAYQNHDIDDGIRAGILNAGDLASLAIWQAAAKEVKKYEPAELWSRAVISRLITLMINDMAAETDRRIAATGITSVEQVNKTKSALAGFSADMLAMTIELKKYLFANFYSSKGVADYHKKGKKIIHTLFQKFIKDPGLMPEKTSSNVRDPIEIVVKDYIAGMTDNFALEMYNKFKI